MLQPKGSKISLTFDRVVASSLKRKHPVAVNCLLPNGSKTTTIGVLVSKVYKYADDEIVPL